jgi:hypothetical protein
VAGAPRTPSHRGRTTTRWWRSDARPTHRATARKAPAPPDPAAGTRNRAARRDQTTRRWGVAAGTSNPAARRLEATRGRGVPAGAVNPAARPDPAAASEERAAWEAPAAPRSPGRTARHWGAPRGLGPAGPEDPAGAPLRPRRTAGCPLPGPPGLPVARPRSDRCAAAGAGWRRPRRRPSRGRPRRPGYGRTDRIPRSGTRRTGRRSSGEHLHLIARDRPVAGRPVISRWRQRAPLGRAFVHRCRTPCPAARVRANRTGSPSVASHGDSRGPSPRWASEYSRRSRVSTPNSHVAQRLNGGCAYSAAPCRSVWVDSLLALRGWAPIPFPPARLLY